MKNAESSNCIKALWGVGAAVYDNSEVKKVKGKIEEGCSRIYIGERTGLARPDRRVTETSTYLQEPMMTRT